MSFKPTDSVWILTELIFLQSTAAVMNVLGAYDDSTVAPPPSTDSHKPTEMNVKIMIQLPYGFVQGKKKVQNKLRMLGIRRRRFTANSSRRLPTTSNL